MLAAQITQLTAKLTVPGVTVTCMAWLLNLCVLCASGPASCLTALEGSVFQACPVGGANHCRKSAKTPPCLALWHGSQPRPLSTLQHPRVAQFLKRKAHFLHSHAKWLDSIDRGHNQLQEAVHHLEGPKWVAWFELLF